MKTRATSDKVGKIKDAVTNGESGVAGLLPRIEHTALEQQKVPSVNASRYAQIAEAAYFRAEKRGFAAGGELEDWLAAEQEVDERARLLQL